MARTVAAGSGSLLTVTVWCTVRVCTSKNAGGNFSVPSGLKRSDSSAPQPARVR